MRHTKYIAPLAAAAALTATLAGASTASAATGGGHAKTNPGVVALTDDAGNHLCSGVLVAPQWVLSVDGSLPCWGSSKVTGDVAKNAVTIDGEAFPHAVGGDWEGNDPSKSQARLIHLDKPVKNVTPAKLSDAHPVAGETLSVASFNGPEGINHTLSIGTSAVKVDGHRNWLSWYGKPKTMKLEGPIDNGAPIMRGNTVVAFVLGATERGFSGQDISDIHAWVTKQIAAK